MAKERKNPWDGLDLSVDEAQLTEQWGEQPALMLEYGLLLADAEDDVDNTKARLGQVSAELETDIRNNPTDYGIMKVTEAAIAAAVPQQKDYISAVEDHNNAKSDARHLRAVVDALSHRKAALQGKTELFQRQWFAERKGGGSTDGGVDMTAPPVHTQVISRRTPRKTKE